MKINRCCGFFMVWIFLVEFLMDPSSPPHHVPQHTENLHTSPIIQYIKVLRKRSG
ncbi:hypothetical protein SRHO_G00304570 [Serrasalmus rhombeus]